MTADTGFSFLAPAKLNISLKVFGRRPDGYHHVRSIMVPVSLYDEVIVEAADSGIRVTTDDTAIPGGSANICHRAASLYMEWAGEPEGVEIRIRKGIPVEAGLGGGSSDAAATFKGLMAITGRVPEGDILLRMAGKTGADVPFFTRSAPALAEGFGERLTPVEWRVPFFTLIVKPPFGLSTREGYERLRRGAGDPPGKEELPAFHRWEDVVLAVSNDFEAAWKDARPEIEAIKEELYSAGARAAGLSGSGSAVFGLFENAEAAHRARGMLSRDDGRRLYVARNI